MFSVPWVGLVALRLDLNNEYFLLIGSCPDADTEGYCLWKSGHVIVTLVNVEERTCKEAAMVFAAFLCFLAGLGFAVKELCVW